jgi:GNAT superfamily N-acetyltransferase
MSDEDINYIVFESSDIHRIREEIIEFLLSLDEERKTLFREDEINEGEYPKTCENAASKIHHVVVAFHGDEMVGLSSMMKRGVSRLAKISPFVRGFLVVHSNYQGKGIGKRLSEIQIEYTKRMWYFWHSIIKVGNERMVHINKKYGFVLVGKDDRYYHMFAPTRGELRIFSPIVFVLLRLYYIERYRIRKLFTREYRERAISVLSLL